MVKVPKDKNKNMIIDWKINNYFNLYNVLFKEEDAKNKNKNKLDT